MMLNTTLKPNKMLMMPISKRFNTNVMMKSPSSNKKSLMPRRDQRNSRLNSMRRSPSETKRFNSLRTRRLSLPSLPRRSKTSTLLRKLEMLNGLRKLKSTTTLNSSSKELRKSSKRV